ncbi:ThuA domain-containing protein [Sandaracinomonas limnophila]|uniref:ThuA domain-containing protein n=1 Tax=Sandaracinomonas limnophila TaxID=1862386 RepID=A0A437PTE2_9BACT|nr:ThuA domain-containing protein [Sandaracinomonas limnophila]RVU25524.1 ThuA domain-containing protein [Sandaracinomonas limnophila]
MKKFLKIFFGTILVLIVLLVGVGAMFFYKVKNGFPVSYETEKPVLSIPANKSAILVFSKTTGFRHAESIDASIPAIKKMEEKNNWYVYATEQGGVFNAEQLKQFKVVVFNNSTGRVLSDEQQKALQEYVENGGSLLGIHGAGDNSHHAWDWYTNEFLGAVFSHHSINPHLQKTEVKLETDIDTLLGKNLAKSWNNTDEWYVFLSQPKGAKVLYYIDGDKIIPNGNMLWIKDKNFGMGKYHPVAWYRQMGKGKAFYTSMGHSKDVWTNPDYLKMIENSINWTIKK